MEAIKANEDDNFISIRQRDLGETSLFISKGFSFSSFLLLFVLHDCNCCLYITNSRNLFFFSFFQPSGSFFLLFYLNYLLYTLAFFFNCKSVDVCIALYIWGEKERRKKDLRFTMLVCFSADGIERRAASATIHLLKKGTIETSECFLHAPATICPCGSVSSLTWLTLARRDLKNRNFRPVSFHRLSMFLLWVQQLLVEFPFTM